jgi:hypothetical protein
MWLQLCSTLQHLDVCAAVLRPPKSLSSHSMCVLSPAMNSPVGSINTGVNPHPTQAFEGGGQPIQTFIQPFSPANAVTRLFKPVLPLHPAYSLRAITKQPIQFSLCVTGEKVRKCKYSFHGADIYKAPARCRRRQCITFTLKSFQNQWFISCKTQCSSISHRCEAPLCRFFINCAIFHKNALLQVVYKLQKHARYEGPRRVTLATGSTEVSFVQPLSRIPTHPISYQDWVNVIAIATSTAEGLGSLN